MIVKTPYQIFLCVLLCTHWLFEKGVSGDDNLIQSAGDRYFSSNVTSYSGFKICEVGGCNDSSLSQHGPRSRNIRRMKVKNSIDHHGKLKVLHVSWKHHNPKLLSHTTGYMVNIRYADQDQHVCCYLDGAQPKVAEPNLSLSIDFEKGATKTKPLQNNARAISNPNGTIFVAIDVLPLNPDSSDEERTLLQIDAPGDDERYTAPEGGTCSKDCNTFSAVDGKVHLINCTISTEMDFRWNVAKCDEVNRNPKGTPSEVERIPKKQEWYKFSDNGEVKLALNFSWMPGSDSSISSLLGFRLKIKSYSSNLANFEKCFSIHTDLTESQHKNAEFFYDCYGVIEGTSVMPGERYRVSIQSRKGNKYLDFDVNIPRCSDKRLKDVTHCIETNKSLSGEVEEIYCNNRSIKYSYDVPVAYGDHARIVFCENGTVGAYVCKNIIGEFNCLQPAGTLYNISLDSSANLYIGYSLYVEGDGSYDRYYSRVDFSGCPQPVLPVSPLVKILVSISVSCFVIAIAILAICCFCSPRKKLQPILIEINSPETELRTDAPHIPRGVKVLVTFADDHDIHKKAVVALCNFLKADLGLDIIFHLWQQQDFVANRSRYTADKFLEADKVLIICSEGTKDCLSQHNEGWNMHSTVINLALGNNLKKCVVAFFDYSSRKHVPKQFPNYIEPIKLMDGMASLYFRLVSVEQYQRNRILQVAEVENLKDPEKRSLNGQALYDKITAMKNIMRNEPHDNGDGT